MKCFVTLLAWIVVLGTTAPAAAAGGLELRAAAVEATVESGTTVGLVATFANTGDEYVQLFLPRHVGTVNFPLWILRHEDGRLFTPEQPVFQSMWKRGVQGDVLRLAPGATRTFRSNVVRVLPFDQALDRPSATQRAATFLPPGRYAVGVRYVRTDDRVPFSEEAFRTVTRRHEGLWTGRVESATIPLVIQAAKRFALTLTAPETVSAGAPYPVALRIANESDKPLDDDVALLLSVGTKAYGSGSIRFRVEAPDLRQAWSEDETQRLALAPGASCAFTLDLTEFTYERTRTALPSPASFYDMLGVGTFHLGARIVDGEGRVLTEAGMFRAIRPVEPAERLGGLRLQLEAADDPRGRPCVTLTLRNEGSSTSQVPDGLSWPRRVFFALTQEGVDARYAVTHGSEGRHLRLMRSTGPTEWATLPAPLTWNGDRHEAPSTEAHPCLAALTPGASLSRTFVVGDLLAEEMSLESLHGSVRITAYWQNRDSGARWRLARPLVVGLLRSNAIELRRASR